MSTATGAPTASSAPTSGTPAPSAWRALQQQLDTFRSIYNQQRPHRALDRRTPATAYTARTKAHPGNTLQPAHFRLRNDVVDNHGKVTLRHAGVLHHIGIDRRPAGQTIRLLIHDTDIRVITTDGELLKELTLNPTTNYQPQ